MADRAIEILPRRPYAFGAGGAAGLAARPADLSPSPTPSPARATPPPRWPTSSRLAGVSRRTFYEHFDDKEACFLASYDTGAQAIYDAMLASAEGIEGWEQVLDAVFGTWLAFLEADLAFTRAYMVEFWAAGDAARERWKERRERTAGLLRVLHERARAEDPAIVPVSDTVIAAVVGGVNRVVISRVLEERDEPLTALKPELLRFIKLSLASRSE